MVKFKKLWKLNSTGGEKFIKRFRKQFIKGNPIPTKIVKLKKPIGKHTHALYYRPIDLRTRRRNLIPLKDWKKTVNKNNKIVFLKGKNIVAINDYEKKPYKYRWQVGTGIYNKYGGVNYKYFKTKTQALAYAKSYMRKN